MSSLRQKFEEFIISIEDEISNIHAGCSQKALVHRRREEFGNAKLYEDAAFNMVELSNRLFDAE